MKLIIGLGNIGHEYENTRHNTGSVLVRTFMGKKNLVFDQSEKLFDYKMAEFDGIKVTFAALKTYMNLSGGPLKQLVDKFHVDLGDLLLCVDDINLPLGKMRIRARGSAGGHNGLESVILALGSNNFARLRLGIGRGENESSVSDHVLSKFTVKEEEIIAEMIEKGCECMETWIKEGINKAMQSCN